MLIPKLPLLKEWAYAGFFFVMSGAIFSHIAVADPMKEILPALLLLILTVTSWYFRPQIENRCIQSIGRDQEFGPTKIATEAHGILARFARRI